MTDLTNIKNFKLKIIFLIHFTLISVSSLGHWDPSAYLFYNLILILSLLWSIHSYNSEEPVQIIVFLLHFFFVSLVGLGDLSVVSFLSYNLLFMVSVAWGLDNWVSEKPVQLAFAVNAISIALDVIMLILNFSDRQGRDTFSGVMAVLHLLVRPFTTIALGRLIQERLGSTGPLSNISDLFPAGRTSYEDIDKTAQASQSSHGAYDFSSAQQI